MTDIGKLNVGHNRSAGEVLDMMLLREALEALARILPVTQALWEEREHELKGGEIYGSLNNTLAAITKLEQRLLQE